MENMNATARESRKKFLVPLVVLLLCAVSLVGAAYAYSSSVTIEDNKVTSDEYVLEVYDSTKTNRVSDPLTLKALDLTHVTVIGDEDSVKVVAEAKTGYTYLGKLTLKDTTVTGASGTPYVYADVSPIGAITVDGSALTVAEVTGSGSLGYTISIALFKDNAGNKGEAYAAGDEIAFANSTATLWYEVTVAASGNGITFANHTAQEDINAVQNALNGKTYVLSFVAQPTARA